MITEPTKSHPMLFNTLMVDRIQLGYKTETRRLKGLEKFNINPGAFSFKDKRYWVKEGKAFRTYFVLQSSDGHENMVLCPWNVGDTLWVRETWAHGSDSLPFVYRSGYPNNIPPGIENLPDASQIKWKPAIHMPRDASRLLLQINAIELQRIESIKEAEAIAEGIEATFRELDTLFYANYSNEKVEGALHPIESFRTLWSSIHGDDSWKNNPWVWALKFNKIIR